MKTVINPSKDTWSALCERPAIDASSLEKIVSNIMQEVSIKGDEALRFYSKKFDNVSLDNIKVDLSQQTFDIDKTLKSALSLAKSNIEKFHTSQQEEVVKTETQPGVSCWRKSVPIEKVGLYIPGGTAPLFSTLLMLAIPARLAGCKEIVVCTPPQADGNIHPVIGYACQLLDIKEVYLTGGAQAIAAMTYGTESIPATYKIFGPGNQFVTAAKQAAQKEGVAIDMPAGPSEVLIIADESAEPSFIAADLLSQAEHGKDSQVVLVSPSQSIIDQVKDAIVEQLKELPRKEIAKGALTNSRAIVVQDLDEALAFSNEYAPEHLIIATENCESIAEKVTNAGSVFLGNWSCESAGDYASGTNHTLPTNGYARNYSGVSLDSFLKKITFQKLSKEGLQNIGPAIETMAAAEELIAHKNAVTIRLNYLQNV